MNSNFCNLPFIAVDRRPNGTLSPCCQNNKFNSIRFTGIDDYWNSNELQSLRNNFLLNIKDSSCQQCWNSEEVGVISLRQTSLDRTIQQPNKITQIKLISGNECNISCMSCFSTVSSSYNRLWKDDPLWIMPDEQKHATTYDLHIDQWIRNNYQQLEYLEVLGGEPLYSKRFFKLVDFLIEANAAKSITLFLVSNGTLITKDIIKKLKHFKKVVITISIDAVGRANDYIRWMSNFKIIERNLALVKTSVDCSVLPTISALNICRIHELYEYCDKRNIKIVNPGLVLFWDQLNPEHIPEKLKKTVDSKFSKLVDKPGDPDKLLKFINSWDKKRNIFIGDYMSEWKEFFKGD